MKDKFFESAEFGHRRLIAIRSVLLEQSASCDELVELGEKRSNDVRIPLRF